MFYRCEKLKSATAVRCTSPGGAIPPTYSSVQFQQHHRQQDCGEQYEGIRFWDSSETHREPDVCIRRSGPANRGYVSAKDLHEATALWTSDRGKGIAGDGDGAGDGDAGAAREITGSEIEHGLSERKCESRWVAGGAVTVLDR